MSISNRKPADKKVLDWVHEVEGRGAGEILLTSMDRDGTGMGFDCPLTAAVAGTVSIPVIASGGAGAKDRVHYEPAAEQGRAEPRR